MAPPFTERTLVLIKPDGVRRGLIGEVIGRFEHAGLTVIGMKFVRPSEVFAAGHYPATETQLHQMGSHTLEVYSDLRLSPIEAVGTDDPMEIGRLVHHWHAEYLSSGPVVALALEGVHAVSKVRAICGPTMPKDAPPGTIRGDFASTSPAVANVQKAAVRNVVHASEGEHDPEQPRKEIEYWFESDDLIDYELSDVATMYAPES
jgi:nucleoside-diphosphate kinase